MSAEGTPARARAYLTGRLAWPIDGPARPGLGAVDCAANAFSDVLCWPPLKLCPARGMGALWLSSTEDRARSGPGSSKLSRPMRPATGSGRDRGPLAAQPGSSSRACDSRQPTTAHGQLHVCEGEVRGPLGKGFAIAAGGSSGFQVAACRDPDQRARCGSRRGRWCASSGKRGGRSKRTACMHSMMTGLTQRMCSPLKSESGASIREYDGGLPRDESEQKAWAASAGRVAARAVETMRSGKTVAVRLHFYWHRPAPAP